MIFTFTYAGNPNNWNPHKTAEGVPADKIVRFNRQTKRFVEKTVIFDVINEEGDVVCLM